MKLLAKIFSALIILLVGFGCSTPEVTDESDRKLARVFKHKLMTSDLEGMFSDSPSAQDSALLANSFVENWVRENLLMQEAEKKIPKNLNIDELVRNYRSSLIKHNYEKLIIELQLDSTVTAADVNKYYELNKEQFKLKDPLYQVNHIVLPDDTPNIAKVRNWWNKMPDSTSLNKLTEFCLQQGGFCQLSENKWKSFDQLKDQLPSNFSKNRLTKTANLALTDNGDFHLIKVTQKLNAGNNAPLSTIKDKAERVILHTRKIDLIKEKKEELYDREMRLKNIEIYTQ